MLDFACEIFDLDIECADFYHDDEGEDDSEKDGEEDVDDKEVDKDVPMPSNQLSSHYAFCSNQFESFDIDPNELFLGVLDPPPELS